MLCEIVMSAGINDILHTHNPFFQIDDPTHSILLFSLRKGSFRSIMSCLVGKRTNVFKYYNNNQELPEIKPFEIECRDTESEFQKQYRWHKFYVQSHDISKPYHLIQTFYLEDFANNYDLIYRSLGLTQHKPVKATIESAYKYKDLVLNYRQCKEVFDQLELSATFTPILTPFDPNLPN